MFIPYNKSSQYTTDEISTIIELYKTHSNKDIAEVLCRTPRGIEGIITKLQLTDRPSGSTIRKRKGQKKIEDKYGVPITWLLKTMHWDLNIPIRNGIDKKLKLSTSTVKEWMVDLNIQNRTVSEDNIRRFKNMSIDDKQKQVVAANNTVRQKGQPKLIGKRGWSHGLTKHDHPGLKSSSEKHIGNKNPMYGIRGESHHSWKGGKIWWRGANWDRIKNVVKTRDKYMCQKCFVTETEYIKKTKQPLQVHHIELYRINKNNDIDNLITVCGSCHAKLDAINLKKFKPVLECEKCIQKTLF